MDTTNVIDYTEQLKSLNDSQNTINQSIVDLKTYLESTLTIDDKNILVENHYDLLNRFDSIDTSLKNIDKTLQSLSEINSSIINSHQKIDILIDKLDSLNQVGMSINDVGATIGTYALIIVPAVGVIWILYKLIHMWIKPFV